MAKTYSELKHIAMKEIPEVNACMDCGDWLHFYIDGDIKGHDIAVSKETGETACFVELITFDRIGPSAIALDFETGEKLL